MVLLDDERTAVSQSDAASTVVFWPCHCLQSINDFSQEFGIDPGAVSVAVPIPKPAGNHDR
jgi:hypothetical protein